MGARRSGQEPAHGKVYVAAAWSRNRLIRGERMRLARLLIAGAVVAGRGVVSRDGDGGKRVRPADANQPAPAVVVTPAHVENVAPVSSFIGHVQAIQSVQIVPRVTAFIEDEPTPQGSDVKAGQVLFVLQKAQYEAAVQSAQAKLASANAALANAQRQYERAAQLATRGYEATANLDVASGQSRPGPGRRSRAPRRR